MHHGAGNIFHALHEFDEFLPVVRFAGGEADAAIAHDSSGDAVPGRGRCVWVPDRLAIIVGVNVDESGGDEFPARIDFLFSVG